MSRNTIVVLEDERVRVDWLKTSFKGAHVVWANTVDAFFEKLRVTSKDEIALIILDHDLGSEGWDSPLASTDDVGDPLSIIASTTFPLDANGANGMMAVDVLDGWNDIPVIVWSINGPRRGEMVARLRDKGFVAEGIPFSSKVPLARGIASVLSP